MQARVRHLDLCQDAGPGVEKQREEAEGHQAPPACLARTRSPPVSGPWVPVGTSPTKTRACAVQAGAQALLVAPCAACMSQEWLLDSADGTSHGFSRCPFTWGEAEKVVLQLRPGDGSGLAPLREDGVRRV